VPDADRAVVDGTGYGVSGCKVLRIWVPPVFAIADRSEVRY